MAKIRKKIDKSHFYRYSKKIQEESKELKIEFDQIAKIRGWANGDARIFAFMKDYIHYHKKENLEFEGD